MENYLIPVIPFHQQILVRGDGSYVYDEVGEKYLDLNAGQFCAILGHGNKKVVSMIEKISRHLVHTNSGTLSDGVLRAAQALHKISGDMKAYSIFLSTGAEAVEFSIRYAKHITNREGIVCFDKGYHGLTLGAQSVTFGGIYAKPSVKDVFSVPIPDTFADEKAIKEYIAQFEKIMKVHGFKIAAVIMEPIVSVGGMIGPPKCYFERVAAICEQYGSLLVFDECQTGFGRTGKWFYYQHINIIPDMVICAKGIGLGYPLSSVMMKQGIIKDKKITMTHYSSHQNDPLAEIISFAIDEIEQNDLIKQVAEKGTIFLQKLKALCEINRIYRNPRGWGLMLGIDLYVEGVYNYRPIYQQLSNYCISKKVFIQGTDGGRVLRFLPDYFIGEKEMDLCINTLMGFSIKDDSFSC